MADRQPGDPCGEVDPQTGATCALRDDPAMHSDHAGFHGDERVFWSTTVTNTEPRRATSLAEAAADIKRLEGREAWLRRAAHPTEASAAALSSLTASSRRRQVLGAILMLGTATDDEIAVYLDDDVMSPPRVASRRGELVAHGIVWPVLAEGDTLTRPTRTGAEAIVWHVPRVVLDQIVALGES